MQITRLTDNHEIDLLIIRDTNTRRWKKPLDLEKCGTISHSLPFIEMLNARRCAQTGIKSLCNRRLRISRKEDAGIFPPEKLQLPNKPLKEGKGTGGKGKRTKERAELATIKISGQKYSMLSRSALLFYAESII